MAWWDDISSLFFGGDDENDDEDKANVDPSEVDDMDEILQDDEFSEWEGTEFIHRTDEMEVPELDITKRNTDELEGLDDKPWWQFW